MGELSAGPSTGPRPTGLARSPRTSSSGPTKHRKEMLMRKRWRRRASSGDYRRRCSPRATTRTMNLTNRVHPSIGPKLGFSPKELPAGVALAGNEVDEAAPLLPNCGVSRQKLLVGQPHNDRFTSPQRPQAALCGNSTPTLRCAGQIETRDPYSGSHRSWTVSVISTSRATRRASERPA